MTRTHRPFVRYHQFGLIAALAVLLASTAAAYPVPAPPELVTVTKGRVALGIPAGWKESPVPAGTDLLGYWSKDGKGLLESSEFVLLGKTASVELKLDPKQGTVLSDVEITVGGQAARRVVVQDNGGGASGLPAVAGARAIGIVLKKPGADGKYLTFILAGRADQWNTLGPLFDRVVASITIDGVGTTAGVGDLVTVLTVDKGVEKPLEGATVLVGRRLHLLAFGSVPPGEFWEDVLNRGPASGGAIDLVAGEVVFLTATTGANGTITHNLPPGTYDLIVWKAGHVPQHNFRVTLPGGGRKAYVTPDTQVGATGRHQTLDTSRVFKMAPPKPGQPVIWGRVTLGTRTTPTPTPPAPAPGEDVTVVVGENLSFVRKEDPRSPGAFTDVVQGDVIYAEVKTNKDGTFAVPMPSGPYSLIIWKRGYIPEERVNVRVWPGDYFCKLIVDDQPGRTDRHQALDTTSQNIPRKKLEAKPGIRGVVRVSDRGVRTPADGATVLVGKGLRLEHPQIPDPTDKVIGALLVARAQTNKDGEFFVPVPAGTYQLIVWKDGCVPQEFDTVAVPPGVHNVTLLRDNQPGSSGRHRKLDSGGVPVPPPAAPAPGVGAVLPLPFLSLVLGAAPPELTPRTVGNVTLSVPAEWRKDPDTPADEAVWLVGKADRPDVSFSVLRDVSFDGLLEQLVNPVRAGATISSRAAVSYSGVLRDEPKIRVWFAVLTAPEKDGRRIAFVTRAPDDAWGQHAPTFEAVLASVRLPAGITPVPPLPPEEGLKELTRVTRIPEFKVDISYTAYEDRVVLTTAGGATATLGVAGRGKGIGTAFRAFLDKEKAVAAVLGEAVSLELRTLGGTLLVQLFEGGALVQEKATGVVWWNAHPARPRDLRPADEITRYPGVVFNGVRYTLAAYPDRAQVWDVAARKEMVVKVGPAGPAVPEAFRKVIDRDKIEPSLGRAASGEAALFDTPVRVQVYEGGIILTEPGTDKFWWCTHPKRVAAGGGGVVVPPKPVLALPKDPDAVVLRLDYVGGYTPPRKTNDPYLVILADGRVTLTDPFGSRPTVRAKITPQNVLDFVTFAVAENHFFDLDTAAIDQAVKAAVKTRKVPTVTDLPTTAITVRTADRVHEVRCYAPEFYAEQLPDLKSVRQFQAVHARLARYMDALRGEK